MQNFQDLHYHLRTFGCQMNKHDSERVAGMLEALGAHAVDDVAKADIVVFMTCCVREAADVRLMGQVASLKNLPQSPIIAVGGCIGQRDGEKLIQQIAHIDVVFGTHNIAHLPQLLFAAMQDGSKQVEVVEDVASDSAKGTASDSAKGTASSIEEGAVRGNAKGSGRITTSAHENEDRTAGNVKDDVVDGAANGSGFIPGADIMLSTDLPAHREHAWHAWLPIMTGCNNFCSYCVVPYVRGREKSRPMEDVLAEAERLVAEGVLEITLLGQNVNSYGRDLYGEPRFAEILRTVGNTGIQRLRFTTSHPKDLSSSTIAAFAEVPCVMPQLHLPVQSGSNEILKAMNRHYSSEQYLTLVDDVRSACRATGKDVVFSTDLIVGFPGESQKDFDATMGLVRKVGYSQAFTFIYSKREGTPAADLVDNTPHEVIQERFDALVKLVQQSAYDQNQKEMDKVVPVLFEGTSKRNSAILAGKSPKNQTVHVALPADKTASEYAGTIRNVHIEEAKTWYLRGRLL